MRGEIRNLIDYRRYGKIVQDLTYCNAIINNVQLCISSYAAW